jgi:hypothetical protein
MGPDSQNVNKQNGGEERGKVSRKWREKEKPKRMGGWMKPKGGENVFSFLLKSGGREGSVQGMMRDCKQTNKREGKSRKRRRMKPRMRKGGGGG